MKLLYFAWLKTRIGKAEEVVVLPDGVKTVAALVAWLKGRGPGYAEALADMALIRIAVNQEHADMSAAVAPGDEVALFPPVTGGAGP